MPIPGAARATARPRAVGARPPAVCRWPTTPAVWAVGAAALEGDGQAPPDGRRCAERPLCAGSFDTRWTGSAFPKIP